MSKIQNTKKIAIGGVHTESATKGAFELPTLDQFMELISGEDKPVMATTSGYNVYNKYNKTS